ncbi:DUF1885 family protein [Paenibacillus sepulcri]|uniref:DUF1885 family protein n=1 Tax=Paenibacillus sepulcri TaxID=359917 RepID=A0ABS7BX53_9BACL|nr:DUF1885 family protein [Paenibacillus sepulcri]
MSQSAYIKFVDGSIVQQLSLDEVKEHLARYQEQTALTGQQLGWDYSEAAFPYTVETKPGEEQRWFYLKGTNPLYYYILFGVGSQNQGEREIPYVQVVLPEGATHGDKAKGNELCKYLAKHLKAELMMFNGRTIYYNPRK